MSASTVSIEQIADAGVVGAGGAGFPTHVKLSAKADTVIRHFAEPVLAGLAAAMRLVGAPRGIIGIKEKYADVIAKLQPLLQTGMDIAPLSDAYPAGDEMILVYETLGRVVPPGGIPLNVGAVVMNVETAMNVALAPEKPVTTTYLTVGGAVAEPLTLCAPIGTPMSQCVAAAGGPTCEPANYMVGGVMMGYIEDDHDAVIDKTTGGILVLPDDHVVVRRRRMDWKQIARVGRSACDQCSFCTELCPRWLLGHPIEPHRAMRSLGFNLVGEANVQGTSFCCECNLCSLYSCPEDLDPKSVCAQNKLRIATEKSRWQDPPFDPRRAELHMANRKAPMARLVQKLGLTGFSNVGPMTAEPLRPRRGGIKLVSIGDKVRVGDLVGRVPIKDSRPALGAPVHASIDGTVKAIDDVAVWIEA